MPRLRRPLHPIALLLAATAFAPPALAQPAPAAVAAQTEDQKLFALFAASDEATLKRNPLNALFRGDLRYADQFGDYVSQAYFDAERKAGESDLAALHAIDRNKLDAQNKIAYDVFEWQTRTALDGLRPEILALTAVRPMNHFSGFQTFYPTFASGKGAAPFNTVMDYDNNLKRHAGYVAYLDAAIDRKSVV